MFYLTLLTNSDMQVVETF